MEVTQEMVKKISYLSRIFLSEDDVEKYKKEFPKLIGFVSELQKMEVSSREEKNEQENFYERKDEVENFHFKNKDPLDIPEDSSGSFYKVPRIFE